MASTPALSELRLWSLVVSCLKLLPRELIRLINEFGHFDTVVYARLHVKRMRDNVSLSEIR